jgi:hypothetical protein
VEAVKNALEGSDTGIEHVVFCCFSATDLQLYEDVLTRSG